LAGDHPNAGLGREPGGYALEHEGVVVNDGDTNSAFSGVFAPHGCPLCEPTAQVRATLAPTLMSSGDEAHQLRADDVFFDEEPVVAELGVDDHGGVAVDVARQVP